MPHLKKNTDTSYAFNIAPVRQQVLNMALGAILGGSIAMSGSFMVYNTRINANAMSISALEEKILSRLEIEPTTTKLNYVIEAVDEIRDDVKSLKHE